MNRIRQRVCESLFNYRDALRRFRDPQMVREMIAIYLEEAPSLIDNLDRAYHNAENPEPLALQSHRLKGCLAMLGARGLAQQAEELTRVAREDERGVMREVYRDFRRRLDQLEDELKDVQSRGDGDLPLC